MSYSTGEKPGKSAYVCTTCGQTVVLDDTTDTLLSCPKCHETSYTKA
ncbi:rubredoxin-like protein [Clostridium diolis]|nr:rubredoxin-like protein [Clostridium diolis]OVE68237.1 rubredoxin-like protein [Clostridium diolis]